MPLVTLPQFTETEIKIVGPLTFKQLIYALVIGTICLLLYTSLPRSIAFPVAFSCFVISIFLIAIKKDELPLYVYILAQLKFLFSPKIILWGKKRTQSLFLGEMEIKKIGEEKIKLKKEGALRNLIENLETKK